MSEGGSCESSSRNVGRFTPVVSWVRESVQPRRPSAPISCCFVCSKTLLMRAQDPVLLARGQRLGRGQLIAGFEVSINHNCRFWVSTEAAASRLPLTTLDGLKQFLLVGVNLHGRTPHRGTPSWPSDSG